MSHHEFSNIFYNIHKAPNSCKIMSFILLKNIGYGLYYGIQKMNDKDKPVTYIYESMVVHGMWGCFESFFWPITFPYSILEIFDNTVLLIRDKLKN